MFTACGIDLVDRIWFVYIVVALIVASIVGCVLTSFVTVTLYILSCVDHLPKRHMMCTDVSFYRFTVDHSFYRDIFSVSLAFCYSVVIKSSFV